MKLFDVLTEITHFESVGVLKLTYDTDFNPCFNTSISVKSSYNSQHILMKGIARNISGYTLMTSNRFNMRAGKVSFISPPKNLHFYILKTSLW